MRNGKLLKALVSEAVDELESLDEFNVYKWVNNSFKLTFTAMDNYISIKVGDRRYARRGVVVTNRVKIDGVTLVIEVEFKGDTSLTFLLRIYELIQDKVAQKINENL